MSKYFQKIRDGIDVEPLRKQLAAHPYLWNAHDSRLTREGSPFVGTSDIWVRFRAVEELTSLEKYREPHFAVFYPAWHTLNAIHPIVFDLMARVKATYLGGVLITKVPAGQSVKPHSDKGSWHAEKMDTKVYIPIEANDKCVNYCGDESTVIKVGEAVTFSNLVTHSVFNHGDTDRCTLIVCMLTK